MMICDSFDSITLGRFWSDVPRDVLHIIMEYDGRLRQRSGKYMNQLMKTDARYDVLMKIPKADVYTYTLTNHHIATECYIRFPNKKYKLIIHRNDYPTHVNKNYMQEFTRSFLGPSPFKETCYYFIKQGDMYRFVKYSTLFDCIYESAIDAMEYCHKTLKKMTA